MNTMLKRVLSMMLCIVLVVSCIPVSALAAETTDTLTASLEEAKTYIDALTINNSSNDPETVVKNHGTHFTWDNEKRESSKSYLFDWSYYNGVVFEGMEYVYEVTGEQAYADYVIEYMSSLIDSDGTWATCANNSSKTCAGYNATHGADCYKTASLLLDAYEMTNDDRYLTMAATLYADLDAAAKSYSLSNAGNNYRHTWASDPSPDLWLDGLYMILPFRAEYAKYIGDTEELDLIVERMQWVSDNMYNESKGLFYHAADSATSNSGTYWLRSIGWYAAAIVDIMDSMEGENLETMKTQLKKLVDGMKACQNASNGMWLNNMAASQSSSNPYETSGTALVCYAVMKAVNNGWLDASYADMALLAFEGICSEKLSGTTLTDICFKGAPGDSNSTFYDNEGKGVGPFIMLYAEVLEYNGKQTVEPELRSITVNGTTAYAVGDELTFTGLYATYSDASVVNLLDENGDPIEGVTITGDYDMNTVRDEQGQYYQVTVTYEGISATYMFTVSEPEALVSNEDLTISGSSAGISNVSAVQNTGEALNTVAASLGASEFVAYDLSGEFKTSGFKATVTLNVPESWQVGELAVYHVDGDTCTLYADEDTDPATYTFTTNHFSTWMLTNTRAASDGTNSGSGYLVSLTKVDSLSSGDTIIISDGNGNYLVRNGTSITYTTDPSQATVWTVGTTNSGGTTYFTLSNEGYYLRSRSGNSNYTLNISNSSNNTSYRRWSYDADTGFYYSNRYLRFSNGWGLTQNVSSGYGAAYKYEGVGEAVTFTLNDSAVTVLPGGTHELTGSVVVGDRTYDLSELDADDIEWTIQQDGSYATVSNGTVTGVADGSATVTATLSAVNGTALQENIVLTVPVKVESRTVTNVELVSKTGTVYVGSADTVRTGAQIKVTYDDGSEEYEYVTVGMLSGTYDVKTVGSYSGLTVTYGTDTLDGFTLNVIEKPDMNYPEYPDPGSIDVDKYVADHSQFQNTGVAEIELTTSGLPAQTGVDVILVTDLSNSMAWIAGGKTNASSFEDTKMYDLQQSVASFANTFLSGGDLNTISLVTFGGLDLDYINTGYTGTYADPTQTLLLGSSSAETVSETIGNIRLMADSSYSGGYKLSFDGGATYSGNYGNTNYDYAFMETYSAVYALKEQYEAVNGISYDESGRLIYIIFMTDGAPSNYDGVYYNRQTDSTRPDVCSTWVNESGNTLTYTMGNGNAAYSADAWYRYIAGGTYNSTTQTIPGNPLYWADQVYNLPSVADMFSIGFDIDNGGFSSMTFTEADGRPLAKILENLVTDQTLDVYKADDADTLTQIYAQLASELKLAATNAYFVDQMGSSFDLQMTATVTKFAGTDDEETITLSPAPQITVSTYSIYTTDMVGTTDNGVTVTSEMVGKTYGDATIVEVVTFNEDGTEAYSTVNDVMSSNIIVDGVICAENFWYNTTGAAVMIDTDGDDETDYSLPAETFYWNIGTINNQQFVLSYYVYLTGSAEGETESGTYATNNYATLYYTNWLGNDAYKDTESPALAWESASVYYGFYLVDKNGNPVVNRATGETGLFEDAVKVTSKIFYQEILLNDVKEITTISVASTAAPDGYTVYDNGASYTITIDSAQKVSGWVISNGTTPDTTYVTDYYGSAYTNILDSDNLAEDITADFTSTTVWFAVVWEPSTVPDVVVIDYGLPVDIDVLENDMFGTAGTLVGFGDVDDIPVDKVSAYSSTESEKFGITYTATYGAVSIVDGEARYTPDTMAMDTYDTFAYEVLYTTTDGESQYYYGSVTVIPATTIYYEDTFITFAGNNNGTTTSGIAEEPADGQLISGQWYHEGTTDADATQAEDRPGYYSLSYIDANNIYGYDGAYAQMSEHSLDSAVRVHVDSNSYATASFSFYGTGFDVISLTSNTTGTIVVQVYKDGTRVKNTLVDTYYGMEEDGSISANTPESIYQVPVIKISGMEYAKYDVTITATYNSTLDHTSDDGYDLYLDAIRIYDPAGTTYGEDGEDGATDSEIDDVIEDAYIADGEGYPVYTELRNNIIAASHYVVTENEDGTVTVTGDPIDGVVFIDCADKTSVIADYVSYGPNNELYLANDQAIVFNVNVPENVADIQLGIKMANGTPVTYEINGDSYTVSTATDMYYSILKYAEAGTVTIKNVSGGILSLTNIKVTHTSAPASESGISLLSMDAESTGIALMSLRSAPVVEDEIPETTVPEETEPEDTTPETTVPEETEPETEPSEPEVTEPEEDTSEDVTVEEVVETVKKFVKKLFGWLFG